MNSLFVSMPNSSAVPIRVTSTGTPFSVATIWGFRSFSSASGTPVNNAATIYIGTESGKLGVPITAGSSFTWRFEKPENLSNLWVNGNSGDGAYILSY